MLNNRLQLYLDSADTSLWEKYLPSGIFYGITMNPKLLRVAEIEASVENIKSLAERAFELGANELHLQVWGESTDVWLKIARQLSAIDWQRVMVKVPLTEDGVLCAKELITEGVNITLTAVHASHQVLTAISLGADYIAPYLGRMTDAGQKGIEEIIAMQKIIDETESTLQLLVASIRQIDDVVTLAQHGVSSFTLSPERVEDLLKNDLTQKAANDFENDAKWASN